MIKHVTPQPPSANVQSAWRSAEGSLITALRVNCGLTQTELAEACGWRNKQMISAIETGRIHVPQERAEIMAEILGVDAAAFAKRLLKTQRAWLYALAFGADAQLKRELHLGARSVGGERKGPKLDISDLIL